MSFAVSAWNPPEIPAIPGGRPLPGSRRRNLRADSTALLVGIDPEGLVVADFNGDHRPDFAVFDSLSAQVSVGLNLGGRRFAIADYSTGADPLTGAEQLAVILPAGNPISVGDLNGDGLPDLVVANNEPGPNGSVSVLISRGSGNFAIAVQYPVDEGARGSVIADFNVDGNPDIAIGSRLTNALTVLFGRGDGTFEDPIRWVPPGASTSSAPTSMAIPFQTWR